MSMLSAQCDELRELATRYDELQVGAVKAVTMPSNMGSILREAAYTIWELRDDLQRANAENAKLRELAERAWKSAERLCQAFDGPCRDDGVTIDKPCPMGERDEECVYGQLQRELRECGVEVDA